jgi:hypothetical protein
MQMCDSGSQTFLKNFSDFRISFLRRKTDCPIYEGQKIGSRLQRFYCMCEHCWPRSGRVMFT